MYSIAYQSTSQHKSSPCDYIIVNLPSVHIINIVGVSATK